MKFLNGVFLIMALAMVGFGYVGAVSNVDETRKELEAVYAKIDAAVMDKDIDALSALLADDYEKNDGDKAISRADVITQMKESFKVAKEVKSCKTTITKIQQVEGNEIVDYTQVAEIVIVGADGKDQTIKDVSKGRDWWVKGEDGEWSCVSAERVK